MLATDNLASKGGEIGRTSSSAVFVRQSTGGRGNA